MEPRVGVHRSGSPIFLATLPPDCPTLIRALAFAFIRSQKQIPSRTTMRVYLADLVHSYASGSHGGFASVDGSGFVVPYGIASIAAYSKKALGNGVDISLFKFSND